MLIGLFNSGTILVAPGDTIAKALIKLSLNGQFPLYLDDQVGEHHLLLCDLRHSLLHRVLRDEAVDHDLVLLADTMSSREGLERTQSPIKVSSGC